MNEQELNKKLAEWAGFAYDEKTTPLNWIYPEEYKGQPTSLRFYKNLPDFTQSLDACFKWLVPNLILRKLITIEFAYSDAEKEVRCQIKRFFLPTSGGEFKLLTSSFAETPALALCLAISKLIELINEE